LSLVVPPPAPNFAIPYSTPMESRHCEGSPFRNTLSGQALAFFRAFAANAITSVAPTLHVSASCERALACHAVFSASALAANTPATIATAIAFAAKRLTDALAAGARPGRSSFAYISVAQGLIDAAIVRMARIIGTIVSVAAIN
jgi:hypothetical protein